jgi:hypothetical protein
MKIVVMPVDNGWLVSTNNGSTNKVFIDREAMMEHINDIAPATGEESNFIDNLDADEDNGLEFEDDADSKLTELFNSMTEFVTKDKGVKLF